MHLKLSEFCECVSNILKSSATSKNTDTDTNIITTRSKVNPVREDLLFPVYAWNRFQRLVFQEQQDRSLASPNLKDSNTKETQFVFAWKVLLGKCVDSSPLLVVAENQSNNSEITFVFIGAHNGEFLCMFTDFSIFCFIFHPSRFTLFFFCPSPLPIHPSSFAFRLQTPCFFIKLSCVQV